MTILIERRLFYANSKGTNDRLSQKFFEELSNVDSVNVIQNDNV